MAAEKRTSNNLNTKSGRPPYRDDIKRDLRLTLLVTAIHLPLGLVLYNAGSLSIIHPLLVVSFGLYLAFNRRSKYSDIALLLAYIVGVEVLWRMAKIPVFWELGKYGSVAIILVALIRRGRWEIPKVPLVYFLLLIPACILTLLNFDRYSVQGVLSFNMSGPLLLFFCSWFFYKARLGPIEFRRLLLSLIVPLLCVAFTSLFYTVSAENITFTGESNFETSGGFGPNQVSALLGLGVFAAFAGTILIKNGFGFTIFFSTSALFLAAICMLTFSRGGIYNAAAGIAVLLIFGVNDLRAAVRRIALTSAVVAVFLLLIFPAVNDYTGGALQSRFEDTGTTNRSDIALSDVLIFAENPLFGVGVGASRAYREKFIEFSAASHTELSRLIAEHGLFGIGALFALAAAVVINLRRPNSRHGKAFIAGAFAWSFFFMLNSGMRLAAPSFMWGFGFLSIVSLRGMRPSIFRQRELAKGPVLNRQTTQIATSRP